MATSPMVMQSLAYLTADLPGVGGAIKRRPDDFVVEEIPLYEPSGQGEHLFLLVEKRYTTTMDIIRRLAKMFHVRRGDIGYAGLKDKHAVTRQHFSIRLPDASRDEELLARFEFVPFKLIWAKRHRNKLQRGHLAGNRFDIRIREVEPGAGVVHARRVLERLTATGVPNYFGSQRFGYRQNNHILGRLLLQGRWEELLDQMLGHPLEYESPEVRAGREAFDRKDIQGAMAVWPRQLRHDRQALDAIRQGKSAEGAVMAIDGQQRDFLVSGLQSYIFNRVLDRRVREGLLGQLVEGDLAWKHDSRAVFAVDGATAAAENGSEGRAPKLEVSPSGPMWGQEMIRPTGQVLEWETAALREQGVTQEELCQPAKRVRVDGSRRPMRAVIRNPQIEAGSDEKGPYIRVAFELPRGSFATVVLREIMKNEAADPSDGQETET